MYCYCHDYDLIFPTFINVTLTFHFCLFAGVFDIWQQCGNRPVAVRTLVRQDWWPVELRKTQRVGWGVAENWGHGQWTLGPLPHDGLRPQGVASICQRKHHRERGGQDGGGCHWCSGWVNVTLVGGVKEWCQSGRCCSTVYESVAVSGWRWMSLVQTLVDVRVGCQSGRCCSTVGESVAVLGWRWMSRVQTLVDVREGCQSGRCPRTVNSRVRMEVDVTGAVGVTLVWDVREGVSQVDVPAQLMSQKQSGWRCIWTSHL